MSNDIHESLTPPARTREPPFRSSRIPLRPVPHRPRRHVAGQIAPKPVPIPRDPPIHPPAKLPKPRQQVHPHHPPIPRQPPRDLIDRIRALREPSVRQQRLHAPRRQHVRPPRIPSRQLRIEPRDVIKGPAPIAPPDRLDLLAAKPAVAVVDHQNFAIRRVSVRFTSHRAGLYGQWNTSWGTRFGGPVSDRSSPR